MPKVAQLHDARTWVQEFIQRQAGVVGGKAGALERGSHSNKLGVMLHTGGGGTQSSVPKVT